MSSMYHESNQDDYHATTPLSYQLLGLALVAVTAIGAFGLIQQQIRQNRNANLLTQATNQLTQSQLAASGGIDLSQFSGPISNVSTENNTISIEDTLIYETGYRLTTDGQWQTFDLSGNAQTAAWYTGQAQASLPNGVSDALIFSCSYQSGWDCHGGWQHVEISSSEDTDSQTDQSEAITVRARGKDGTEEMQLRLDDETVVSWTMETSYKTYSYTPKQNNQANVKVAFNNDKGIGHDLIVDYVEINGSRLQAEDQQTNTAYYQNGSCGGSYSENMQCSGFIDFGTHSLTGGDDTGSDADGGTQDGSEDTGRQLGGAIAAYSFDETDGSTVVDAASGNDGQINGANRTDGRFGSGLQFGSDDIVTINHDGSLDNLDQLTLMAWIKPNSAGGSNAGRIIDKSPENNEFLFRMGSGPRLQFDARRWSNQDGIWSTPRGSIESGEWQHVAVTYRYDGTSANPTFYIDGERVRTVEDDQPSGQVADTPGRMFIGNNDFRGRHFDGVIDEVHIFDDALEQATIQDMRDSSVSDTTQDDEDTQDEEQADPPTIEQATINESGEQIILTFDQPVTLGSNHRDDHLNPIDDTPNDNPTMSYASGDGTDTLTFNTSRTFSANESPSIHYDQPGDGLEAADNGADVESFRGFDVTNNSTQGGESDGGGDDDGDGDTSGGDDTGVRASDIQPYDGNRWYWQYEGEPTMLLGGSNDDSIHLWDEGRLANHLNEIKNASGNYVRNVMGVESDEPYPFAKTNGTYDLNRWNEDYWNRLRNFLDETERRDIIAQVTFWGGFYIIGDKWDQHPYNPKNNVNYSYSNTNLPRNWDAHPSQEDHPLFLTPPSLNNDQRVLEFQKKYIRKLLSITTDYKNVLYNIQNEAATPLAWSHYWAEFAQDYAESQNEKIFLASMRDNWDITKRDHREIINRTDIYDYMDVSQNTWMIRRHGDWAAQRGYNHLQTVRSRIENGGVRPVNVVKLYGADGADNGINTEQATHTFWTHLFGGVASVRFHRPDYGIGITETAKKHLRSARRLHNRINFMSTQPSNDLLGYRSRDEAYALADRGDTYAVYFRDGGNVRLDVSDIDEASVRWLDVDGVNWYGQKNIDTGNRLQLSPSRGGKQIVVITAR